MALAANTPGERVEHLMALTERLRTLVERETALFEARRPEEAETFRDEAASLAKLYRLECARIAQDPGLVSGASEARRDALRQETERLHRALDTHQQAVAVLSTLTEGLVRAIADHVATERTRVGRYGPSGAQGAHDSHAAITLDRTT